MMKRQIIGFILLALTILSLAFFLKAKYGFDTGGTNFPVDKFRLVLIMSFCFVGFGLFLLLLTTGAFVFRKQKLTYWSIVWGMTSLVVGMLALWVFALSRNPTAPEWAGFAQMCIYYLISIPFSQIGLLLALLGWRISGEIGNRILSWFTLFCLLLTSIIILVLILYAISISGSGGDAKLSLLGILANILPLCITASLALFILKKPKSMVIAVE